MASTVMQRMHGGQMRRTHGGRPGRGGWWIGALAALLALVATPSVAASEKIVIDGSTGVMPLVAAVVKSFQEKNPGAAIHLGTGLGTKERIQALDDGRIHIALASHGLVADELTRRGMVVHEIAKVAVVMGVNAGVPATNVTDAQICDVYAGRVTSWKDLGGPDLPVAPRMRPDTEVDAEVLRAKIACLASLKMPESVKVMSRSGDMAKELAATSGAIGVTTTTVVEQSGGRIRALSLNGVAPTADNVARKAYVLTRDSFLVTKANPPAAVAKFVEYVRSPAGAAVIAANGAVPVK